MEKKSEDVKSEVVKLERLRTELQQKCDSLGKALAGRKAELESLLPSKLEKPPSPALRPCLMVCRILNCPFYTHCWEPEKLKGKVQENSESKNTTVKV